MKSTVWYQFINLSIYQCIDKLK